MNKYSVIITLLLPQWADIIIADLVKCGYSVKTMIPSGDNIFVDYKNSDASAVCALTVSSDKTGQELTSDLCLIFKTNKIKIYSLVVDDKIKNLMHVRTANFQLERRPKIDPKKIEHLKLVEPAKEDKVEENE